MLFIKTLCVALSGLPKAIKRNGRSRIVPMQSDLIACTNHRLTAPTEGRGPVLVSLLHAIIQNSDDLGKTFLNLSPHL